MQKLLFLLPLIIFLTGCVKEGNVPSNGLQTEEGEIILTSEIVQISVQDAPNDTYLGDIDGIPVNLDKVNDSILVFFATPELPLGDIELTIEDLNLTVNYTIQETVLDKTVEETMQECISKLQLASNDITDSLQSIQVQETVSSFINYYNSLPPDDQLAVAEFYQTNRTLLETSIDGIFKTSGGFNKKLNSSSNFTDNVAKCESGKYKTAILAIITIGLAKSGTGIKLSVLTGAAATYSLVKTIGYCKEVAGSKIRSIYLKAEELLAEAEKNQTEIEIDEETSKFIPISLANRGFQSSDRNDSDAFISSVVKLIDAFNSEVLAKLNAAITKWNEKAPSFFSINTYNFITIPDNASVEEFGLTQELFNNITFSVASNNVEIQSLSFVNGGISLKLRIVNPNIVSNNFLETSLDFTYNDDYNNFSGSFPLKVYKYIDPCANSDAPQISLISREPCNIGTNFKQFITFSYFDPNGNEINNGWRAVSGDAYSYSMPSLISGIPSDGVYSYQTYSQLCCCGSNAYDDPKTFYVQNTCGVQSNVVSFQMIP